MIRVERDPRFWVDVASHPALIGALYGMAPAMLAPIVAAQTVIPLASQHGGFILNRLDAFGFVYELHTLFTPEGWGREVVEAGHDGLAMMFGQFAASAIVTAQTRDNPRSQPPRSFGFVKAGDWRETQLGECQCWILTAEAWSASPARKRRLS